MVHFSIFISAQFSIFIDMRDESLADADNLPDPDVIAGEIAEDLRDALALVAQIEGDLRASAPR